MATEIKIEYSYYSTKRITPVYIVEEELMTLENNKFVERIENEVPHLRKYWYSQSRKHGSEGSRGSQANTDACLTLT